MSKALKQKRPSRRKHRLSVVFAVVLLGVFIFLFLNRDYFSAPALIPDKHQAGYKAEDRQQLEKLIYQGDKND